MSMVPDDVPWTGKTRSELARITIPSVKQEKYLNGACSDLGGCLLSLDLNRTTRWPQWCGTMSLRNFIHHCFGIHFESSVSWNFALSLRWCATMPHYTFIFSPFVRHRTPSHCASSPFFSRSWAFTPVPPGSSYHDLPVSRGLPFFPARCLPQVLWLSPWNFSPGLPSVLDLLPSPICLSSTILSDPKSTWEWPRKRLTRGRAAGEQFGKISRHFLKAIFSRQTQIDWLDKIALQSNTAVHWTYWTLSWR